MLTRTLPTRTKLFLLSALAIVLPLHAQVPAARPEFEVASIKPDVSTERLGNIPPPSGGRFTATRANLKRLIGVAYKMRLYQLFGGPGWIDSDYYDVSARAEGNPPQDQVLVMLQNLLADRFHLKVHRETRELPVYALLVAKNGPKLTPFSGASCVPFDPAKPPPPPPPDQPLARGSIPCGVFLMMRNAVEATKTDMKQFTGALTNMGELGRPVIDKTGLTGTYAIHLEYAPVGGGGAQPLPDAPGPSIFTALQEQLGLKLEAQKAPVEILVIDSAEKPTEN